MCRVDLLLRQRGIAMWHPGLDELFPVDEPIPEPVQAPISDSPIAEAIDLVYRETKPVAGSVHGGKALLAGAGAVAT